MSDQNYGGPPQPSGWNEVPQPVQPESAAGSAQYPPPPPPPPPPGYGAGPGYPPPPPPGGPAYNQPPYGAPTPQGGGLNPNSAAAIAYLTFIPAIIFLVIDPYRRISLVRFHAWQCIVLTCASIAISIVFSILMFLPLHFLWILIHGIIDVVLFVFWIIAIVKASQGERYHIPIVGPIAENFAAKV